MSQAEESYVTASRMHKSMHIIPRALIQILMYAGIAVDSTRSNLSFALVAPISELHCGLIKLKALSLCARLFVALFSCLECLRRSYLRIAQRLLLLLCTWGWSKMNIKWKNLNQMFNKIKLNWKFILKCSWDFSQTSFKFKPKRPLCWSMPKRTIHFHKEMLFLSLETWKCQKPELYLKCWLMSFCSLCLVMNYLWSFINQVTKTCQNLFVRWKFLRFFSVFIWSLLIF